MSETRYFSYSLTTKRTLVTPDFEIKRLSLNICTSTWVEISLFAFHRLYYFHGMKELAARLNEWNNTDWFVKTPTLVIQFTRQAENNVTVVQWCLVNNCYVLHSRYFCYHLFFSIDRKTTLLSRWQFVTAHFSITYMYSNVTVLQILLNSNTIMK